MSPHGNSPHLSYHSRREEAPSMLKNMYVSRRMAWYSLLLAALFIILAACGGESNTATATSASTNVSTTIVGTTNTPSAPSPAPTMVVTITTQSNGTFAFSPQALNITAGTTVIWNNATSAPHTVTGSSFGSATISPGGSFSFKFTQAGTFAYHCMFHPYMTASVKVS